MKLDHIHCISSRKENFHPLSMHNLCITLQIIFGLVIKCQVKFPDDEISFPVILALYTFSYSKAPGQEYAMFFDNDLIKLALKILSLFVLLQEHRVDVRERVP